MATADDVLRASLSRARRALVDAPPRELLTLLEDADAALKKRLKKTATAAGLGMRFSEAQAIAYQRQIDVTIRYVKKRLLGITHERAEAAIGAAVASTASDLQKLERAFSGVVTPLRLQETATMKGIATRAQDALLMQHATSVDRYGDGMIRDFRKLMAQGVATGVSSGQMVDALVGHGGPRGPKVSTAARVDPVTGKVIRLREENIPEGLFRRKRYWAERVVRTEVAHAQNEARLRTIETSKATDFPDMGKKILAVLDNRTALDSLGVHGQVRPTDGLFQDGAGRQYLRPPARPNDRETIVPWRLSWAETPYSAPVPPAELAKLQHADKAPGVARQQMVRDAQAGHEARMTAEARKASRRVTRMVGEKMAREIRPRLEMQRVLEQKTAVATAKGRARVARQRAQEAVGKAEAEAAARAQRVASAAAQKRASQQERARVARAKAAAYRQRRRADAMVRAAER